MIQREMDFYRILRDAKRDPSLKNTLDINALLDQERNNQPANTSRKDWQRAHNVLLGSQGGQGGGTKKTQKLDQNPVEKNKAKQIENQIEKPVEYLPYEKVRHPPKNLEIVSQENMEVLKSIDPPLPKRLIKEMHTKLADFFHIEDLSELRLGRYTRWIRNDDVYSLKTGGTLVDVKFSKRGIALTILPFYSNENNPRFYNVSFDSSFIFQKMSESERGIL
jgi:hypothetical protein